MVSFLFRARARVDGRNSVRQHLITPLNRATGRPLFVNNR